MKDFSNETKSKRRKAVLKVILKRYSFIIWLPLLLCISYNVGKITTLYLVEDWAKKASYPIGDIILLTILGFLLLFASLLLGLFGVIIIGIIRLYIITPLKEKGFINGLKDFLKFIGKSLLNLCKLLPIILLQILKSPIYLCKRIKDEKRRFQNAVEKQISKDSQ